MLEGKEYTQLLKQQKHNFNKDGEVNDTPMPFFEKVNDSLQKSKLRYENLLEHNHVGIITINRAAHLTKVNGIFSSYLKCLGHELIGKSIWDLIINEQIEKVKAKVDLLVSGQIKTFSMENKMLPKAGNPILVYSKVFGEYDNEGKFLSATASVLDITKNRKVESILFESILAFENLDRERIAHLLHEDIGQNLVSIQLMIQQFANDTMHTKEACKLQLNTIKDLLNQTIKDVKEISYKITPEHVTKFGFIPSLYSMVDDLRRKFKNPQFTIYINVKNEIKSTIVQLTLYRVIQEAVNNILKHANAKHASIQLIKSGKSILLTIEDDGIGFDYENTIKVNPSMGLQSIISRSKSILADVFIESKLHKGTIIRVELFIE